MSYPNANVVLAALSEGTIIGFTAYIENTTPGITRAEVVQKLTEMLTVIKWSSEAIAYWIAYYFEGVE
jgi:hypothetical protein